VAAICVYLEEHLGWKAARRLTDMIAPGLEGGVGRRRKRLDSPRWRRLMELTGMEV
jgi:hypothetical protein